MRWGLAMMYLGMQRLKTRRLGMRLATECLNTRCLNTRCPAEGVRVSCPGAGFLAIGCLERGGPAAAYPPDASTYPPPGGPL
jgi:hypothetical protein